jgi:hypothetical protein
MLKAKVTLHSVLTRTVANYIIQACQYAATATAFQTKTVHLLHIPPTLLNTLYLPRCTVRTFSSSQTAGLGAFTGSTY